MPQPENSQSAVWPLPITIWFLVGGLVVMYLLKAFWPMDWLLSLERILRFYPYRLINPGSLEAAPGTAILSSFGYVFLHSGWIHLSVNALLLAYYGSLVLKEFGHSLFILLFILGALAGAGAHTAAYPAGTTPLVGSSAAIAALLGCLLSTFACAPSGNQNIENKSIFDTISKPWLLFPLLAVGFAAEAYIGTRPAVISFLNGRLSWEGHLAGMVTGLVIGWLYLRNNPLIPQENGTKTSSV